MRRLALLAPAALIAALSACDTPPRELPVLGLAVPGSAAHYRFERDAGPAVGLWFGFDMAADDVRAFEREIPCALAPIPKSFANAGMPVRPDLAWWHPERADKARSCTARITGKTPKPIQARYLLSERPDGRVAVYIAAGD